MSSSDSYSDQSTDKNTQASGNSYQMPDPSPVQGADPSLHEQPAQAAGGVYRQAPGASSPLPPTAATSVPPQASFAQNPYQPREMSAQFSGQGSYPNATGQVPYPYPNPTGQVPYPYPNPTGRVPYPYPNPTGQVPYPMPAGAPAYSQPAQPSAFLLGLKQLWPSLMLTWKSRLNEAFDHVLGMKLFWLVSFLAYSLANALFVSFWVGRTEASGVNGVQSIGSGIMDSLGFGQAFSYQPTYLSYSTIGWFQLFISTFLLSFAVLALRALFIKAVAGVRHAPLSYTDAANICGQGILTLTLISATAFVLILLPSGGWLAFVSGLSGFLSIGALFLNELILWVGANKAISSEKEFVIPYVFFSLTWLACICVLAFIFSAVLVGSML